MNVSLFGIWGMTKLSMTYFAFKTPTFGLGKKVIWKSPLLRDSSQSQMLLLHAKIAKSDFDRSLTGNTVIVLRRVDLAVDRTESRQRGVPYEGV